MKKITKEDIKVRLLLLFCWIPFGLNVLIRSRKIKHKVSLGFLYFFLFVVIGLPIDIFAFTLLRSLVSGAGVISSFERALMSFSELAYTIGFYFVPMIISLIVHIVILMCDRKEVTDIETQTNRRGTVRNTNIPPQKQYQQATSWLNNDRNYSTEYNTKLYGVDYQANNNQAENNNAYQKAQVLTEREKNFYETIRLIAEKHNLNVSPKMRLADIVKVNDDVEFQSSEWHSRFNKINKKHVDFALADKTNLEIKLLIEIDDYTHQRADRKERDKFVDSVCEQVNIPILHLYDVVGLEEKIVDILHSEKTEQEM